MSLVLYHDTYAAKNSEPDRVKGHLVLLHGWGMNSLVWDELIPFLNDEYIVTLVDLPGFGRSPMPGGDYNLDYLVEHVSKVVPDKAIYVAWSLGGLVAQHIYHKTPEKVEALILIAATPKFVSGEEWPNATPELIYEKFQELLSEDWQGTLIRFLTLQCKGGESIKNDTQKLRERIFHHGLPAGKALREGLNILRDTDLREGFKEISTPIQIILGANDNLVPASIVNDFQELNNEVQCSVISGAAHVLHISHARECSEIILKFLNATEAV